MVNLWWAWWRIKPTGRKRALVTTNKGESKLHQPTTVWTWRGVTIGEGPEDRCSWCDDGDRWQPYRYHPRTGIGMKTPDGGRGAVVAYS